GTFVAPRDMRVAVLAIGYGDGYKRALSNRASVLIGGRRAKLVGNICMDLMMADVTDIPDVAPGTPVTLIGAQGMDAIGADELAEQCGTISYEILTSFLPRVPKKYVGGEP
ncbi:MAG: alanine racemase, partial [Clostridia bacterium]|nr:alanine racemase [Clostridia bacterium]